MRCQSKFCPVQGGQEFTPNGEQRWCDDCLKLTYQIRTYSHLTADMIRRKYQEYRINDMPEEVKLILTQFTRELVQELGEEL